MKGTVLKKLFPIALALLFLTNALPVYATEEMPVDEIVVNQETFEDILPVDEPPEEPQEEVPVIDTEQTEETTENTPEPTLQVNAADSGLANAAAIQQFFGIDSIEGDEAFYQALFSYAMQRAAAGMPLTIQVPDCGVITFDGTKHQTTFTTGTITTSIPMPAYYVVTFEAVVEGRIPGVYTPVVKNIRVWDSMNNIDMTRMFDASVIGGGMEITSAGSLLMIMADDYEVEFNGTNQVGTVETGQAFINWMPMSDELQLELLSYSCAKVYIGTYDETYSNLSYYAIKVIEDGTDITEYFENIFTYPGIFSVVPPTKPIEIEVQPWIPSFDYTGVPFTDPIDNKVSSMDCDDMWLMRVILTLCSPEDFVDIGTYTLTAQDWLPIIVYGSDAEWQTVVDYTNYFDVTVLPVTFTVF